MGETAGPGIDVLRQLTALNRVARIAVQDMALRPMLQRIVGLLSEEFGWEFVACATIDRARNEFVCEAVAGVVASEVTVGYRRALGTGVVGQCALSGRTIEVADARGHPDVIDTLHGTGSELCVPVLHNGEVLAILNAESRRVNAFRGQRALLETVADQIAGILRAASFLAQLQEANTRLREANAELERLSTKDSLTGIGNRRSFDSALPSALAGANLTGDPVSLLMIDVDCFKAFNDGQGHQAGDACLRDVVGVLSYFLEGSLARLARYGGEEFVVILPGSGPEAAFGVAERLRRAVEARALPHPDSPSGLVSISLGLATHLPGDAITPAALLRAADAALYEAKRGGRNRVAAAPGRA